MSAHKIVLADDHKIVIDGLRSLLEDDERFRIIGEASNGKELLDLIKLTEVDTAIVDIDMPVLNGIEATRIIKQDFPDVRIIILSMHHEKSLIKKFIEMGVDGYLLKNSSREALIDCIEKVMKGQKYFDSDVTLSILGKNPQSAKGTFAQSDTRVELTEREVEIMKLIAEGMSNKEIGKQLHISDRTVDTHRTNLMRKLSVNNVAGIIRYAMKHGYVE
ncbi:MAG: response regulator transcription factor [Bacteroidales bacterium]|nr:response regulator transcription factor [Bacteroidales bacterium]MCF8398107.1 response regulator transcription factor [Bacteroidales bacterium]